jgi:hypothetical protein
MDKKDPALPDSFIVQRDAVHASSERSGSNLEAMMARISADVTRAAAAKRQCPTCGEMLLPDCIKGVMHDGSACLHRQKKKV